MDTAEYYREVFDGIVADQRYQRNLAWGEPRDGHPEGTIAAHIAELEANLDRLGRSLNEIERWKQRILIHVHDTFKPDADGGAAIADPKSHASIASAFLAEFTEDAEMLACVQWHDEPYALWRRATRGIEFGKRAGALLERIADWDQFLAFQIIDGCTAGKDRGPLIWTFETIAPQVTTRWTRNDIL